MAQPLVEQLAPEQEALIPAYREKWRNLALSTEPIDRQKAASAIKNAYAAIGLPEPEIVFYESPYAVGSDRQLAIGEDRYISYYFLNLLTIPFKSEEKFLAQLSCQIQNELREKLFYSIKNELETTFLEIREELRDRLWDELFQFQANQMVKFWQELRAQLNVRIPNEKEQQRTFLYKLIKNQPDNPFLARLSKDRDSLIRQHNIQTEQLEKTFGFDELFIQPYEWVSRSFYDFCINVLNCEGEQTYWQEGQAIVENCGWIFLYEKLAIVCERPRIFSLDSQNRLHGEGKPAIAFADGYSLYAYRGVWLPEKYGKIHPSQWRSQWLLEEDNAELRRVLIQGIGYERIAQDLQATELDTFQEYTLLKIDKNITEEAIYLLKMTCPSTGFVHVLRVPPQMRSAREAIKWVNWGIDPEEFSVQT